MQHRQGQDHPGGGHRGLCGCSLESGTQLTFTGGWRIGCFYRVVGDCGALKPSATASTRAHIYIYMY